MTEEHNFRNDIRQISFPNTVADENASFYTSKEGCKFQEIFKNGEMAGIKWFIIWKDGKPIVEVKESVCNIYLV